MDSLAQLGASAPSFELPDLHGEQHRLRDLRGTVVVLDFWSAECPHSIRTDALLRELQAAWGGRVRVWWVASNPGETLEALLEAAADRDVGPVLLDAEQQVADQYGAEATPQVFLIDAAGVLRYAGALDDVRFGQNRPTRRYLAEAVEAVLQGRQPQQAQTPAYGCAILRIDTRGRAFDG